jgi:hypothetical protein
MATLFLWIFIPSEHAVYKNLFQNMIQVTAAILTCRLIIQLREYGKCTVVNIGRMSLDVTSNLDPFQGTALAARGERKGTLEEMVFTERHSLTMTTLWSESGFEYETRMDADDDEGVIYIYDHDLTRSNRPEDSGSAIFKMEADPNCA